MLGCQSNCFNFEGMCKSRKKNRLELEIQNLELNSSIIATFQNS